MLTYQVKGPNEIGMYLVGYPTPGAEHVFTAAGCASSEKLAKAVCDLLNEAQVVDRREGMVREANMVSNDLTKRPREAEQ